MAKKTNFVPDFGLSLSKFGPQNFFSWVLPLLDVIHCCKLSLYAISKKTNEPNMRKWQKPIFTPNFGPFDPNLGPQISFCEFYPY